VLRRARRDCGPCDGDRRAAEYDRRRSSAPLSRPAIGLSAEERAQELGGELLGFYHSHPDHPARPSQYDLDHAWPTFAYIIVAVANAQAHDMTVWFLKEDRSTFEEGELNGN
jgi:proteasome lid subunit RPN8/RPN11